MKILYIAAILPYPLFSGGQVRMYQLLRALSGKHEIHLLSFLRTKEEQASIEHLSFLGSVQTVFRGRAWQAKYVLRSLAGFHSLLHTSYESEEMKMIIAEELKRFPYDCVIIEPSYVSRVLPEIRIPLIVVEHNIEFLVYEQYVRHFRFPFLRPFLFWDVLKLRLEEESMWKRANHIITVSPHDAGVIRSRTGNQNVSIVPNGVDITAFPFVATRKKNNPVALFVGNFSWMQNRDALSYLLRFVCPLLSSLYPRITLRVVGSGLASGLQEEIKKINGIYVQDVGDIAREYQRAAFLLAPIRIGGGTKYKILEAMASGLPVITSTRGILGLDVKDKNEVYVADDPKAVIRAIGELLTNIRERNFIVKNARKLIEDRYDWYHIAAQLDGVLRQVKTVYD